MTLRSTTTGTATDAVSGNGRAAAKVILFGEHAVVYGVPAIAGGISRGARASARAAQHDSISMRGATESVRGELLAALRACRTSLNAPPAALDLELDIPAGSGLGASAALAVASTRALLDLSGREASEREVFLAAEAWERVFHGNPSGVDVAAACHCRVIRFRRGEDPEPVVLDRALRLVVAQAGPPASTKEMVEGVRRTKERNPVQFERTLDAIRALSENALLALRALDCHAVGKLMDLNQMLLAGWMLSTEDIERACTVAREAGALGAKLTGAGGGGCVIALCGLVGQPSDDERAQGVLSAFEAAGIPAFSTTVGDQLSGKEEEKTA